jgi:TolB-like protein/Tfp pilus assembly protein PilF
MDEAGKPGTPQSVKAPEQQRRVFISYASHDAAVAQRACSALEAAGFLCWIAPRNVLPGTLYADGIVGAINDAPILVLILSDKSVASAHVGKEIERASSKRHPIIVLRTDAAPLTRAFEYFLSESQWIEVSAGGSDSAIEQLVSAVGQHLVTEAVATNRPPLPTTNLSKTATPRRRWLIAGAVVLALAAAYFLVDKIGLHGRSTIENRSVGPSAAISDKSIAVLPFVDMSENKDQEYFSDGLSEELIDMLTKVPDLRVPARTSSFYFKGKPTTIADIAKALNVSHVLEGSVRKAGNNLRVTAQLIRVDNGYHVWSETYDRKLDDIFKIQDDIAYAVVKALKLSLLGEQAPRATDTTTGKAYTLLLQGQFFLFHGDTNEDWEKAVNYYEQVLRLDPTSAPAWAGLSRALVLLAVSPSEWEPRRTRALDAANRALSLNPRLSEAHIAFGKIYLMLDWNWPAAQAAFSQARKLDSANSYPFMWSGEVAKTLGRAGEALQYYQEAITRDPLNGSAYSGVSAVYFSQGRFEEAEAAVRKAAEFSTSQSGLHGTLGLIHLRTGGDPAAVLAEINRETDEEVREYSLAYSYAFLGRRAEADTALARYEKTHAVDQPYSMAILHAIRREPDQAFEWLDRAYQQHDQFLTGVKYSLSLENLKPDPRYKAILRKMNLPE